MPSTPALLASAANQLQKVFETDEFQAFDVDQLLQQVKQAVLHLLRKDLNRLLHILYRVDVDERSVKQAMLAESEEAVAEQIARLIIKRELQKAQTRFMYR